MRILHLIETLDFGGAEKVVVSLANAMAGRHQVDICCLKQLGVLKEEVDPRIQLHCFGKTEGNDPKLPFRLAGFLRRQHYDVIHTHNWNVFLEGGLAGLLAGTRTRVHTVHGPYATYSSDLISRAKLGLRHLLERLVSRSFDRIVPVSNSIGCYVRASIGIDAKLVETIHNGIPGAAALTRPDKGNPAPLSFVTVGRLAAIKNHDLLLNAFREFLKSWPDARLTIVGDGPERSRIDARIAELGIADNVFLPGFRGDVDACLAEAEVFLLTSHYEGISIALLEAMRAGLPAIATSVGGIPETIVDGSTGLLVPPDDETALVAAMANLANAPDLRVAMGRRARERFEREFSLSTMVSRYEALYRGL